MCRVSNKDYGLLESAFAPCRVTTKGVIVMPSTRAKAIVGLDKEDCLYCSDGDFIGVIKPANCAFVQ